MPVLGLGVFRATEEEARQAALWAFEAGYRQLDTAAVYGNEGGVGRAIIDSGLPRKDIFITTKLWNQACREGTQEQAFKNSLKLLKTDYVDLYLIHWPVPGRFIESWKVLEKLYKEGHIKAIGVSNFQRRHLEELEKETSIVPAVNQIECHPLLTQEPLVSYCQEKGIVVTAWSPLGGMDSNLIKNEKLNAIGQKYGKTAAQVIIRWDIQRNIVVIPKSVHQKRIIENANVFDFELTSEDMALIHAMNENKRSGADPDNFNF